MIHVSQIMLCLLAFAAEESSKSGDEATERARLAIEIAKRHAGDYEIFVNQDRSKKLVLHPEPLHRWTNLVPQETNAPSAEVYGGVSSGRGTVDQR